MYVLDIAIALILHLVEGLVNYLWETTIEWLQVAIEIKANWRIGPNGTVLIFRLPTDWYSSCRSDIPVTI